MRSTFIKLPFVSKIFVLSIFELSHKTGLPVCCGCLCPVSLNRGAVGWIAGL